MTRVKENGASGIGVSFYNLIKVRPLSSTVGAEVSGIYLVDCDDLTFREIHSVVCNASKDYA